MGHGFHSSATRISGSRVASNQDLSVSLQVVTSCHGDSLGFDIYEDGVPKLNGYVIFSIWLIEWLMYIYIYISYTHIVIIWYDMYCIVYTVHHVIWPWWSWCICVGRGGYTYQVHVPKPQTTPKSTQPWNAIIWLIWVVKTCKNNPTDYCMKLQAFMTFTDNQVLKCVETLFQKSDSTVQHSSTILFLIWATWPLVRWLGSVLNSIDSSSLRNWRLVKMDNQ